MQNFMKQVLGLFSELDLKIVALRKSQWIDWIFILYIVIMENAFSKVVIFVISI